jgi:assimilatory nitrate reductase catalytic subunit
VYVEPGASEGAAWLVLRAAADASLPAQWMETLDAALAPTAGPDTREYRDARRGLCRRVAWRADGDASFIDGLLWTGTAADAAPGSLLQHALSGHPWQGPRLAVFSGAVAGVVRDPVVCTCRQVTESAIRARVSRGADVAAVKQELGCGTVCGSCLPQVTRLCRLPQRA